MEPESRFLGTSPWLRYFQAGLRAALGIYSRDGDGAGGTMPTGALAGRFGGSRVLVAWREHGTGWQRAPFAQYQLFPVTQEMLWGHRSLVTPTSPRPSIPDG